MGFFILQYAKLRMLELYYNFFEIFCDKSKYEELEMDTDSLYLSLAGDNFEDIMKVNDENDMRWCWQLERTLDCEHGYNFEADSVDHFFPRTCCRAHAEYDKRTPGLFKEEFVCTEMVCLCSKTYCCYCSKTNTIKLSSKGSNNDTLLRDEPMAKYKRGLFEQTDVHATNRGFRVHDNAVVTYEQRKKAYHSSMLNAK